MCLNDLYIINYGDGYGQCKAPLMEKNDKRPFLIKENCNISESIKKDLYNLNTKLNERNKELNKNYKVGVISRGTHSNDYAEFYGIDMEGDKWKDNKVMFVFECPGGNIDASFLNDENTEDYCEVNRKNAVGKVTDVIDMEQYKLHMAKVLWHADPKFVSEDGKEELSKEDYINSYEDFSFFGKYKNYSELMLSIIKTFKLRNFYTTNMFRYEIFEEKDGLESAKNLV